MFQCLSRYDLRCNSKCHTHMISIFTAAQLGKKVAVLDHVEPSVKGKIYIYICQPSELVQYKKDLRHHCLILWKCLSEQAPNGVLVVHVSMLAAFLRSSCTRLLYSGLQSKMLRSMAGRSQSQSAMTGKSIKTFPICFFISSKDISTND